MFNPDYPLASHTGEGRYPAMKKPPRSGQSHDIAPLDRRSACPELVEGWEISNQLDTGLRRCDELDGVLIC